MIILKSLFLGWAFVTMVILSWGLIFVILKKLDAYISKEFRRYIPTRFDAKLEKTKIINFTNRETVYGFLAAVLLWIFLFITVGLPIPNPISLNGIMDFFKTIIHHIFELVTAICIHTLMIFVTLLEALFVKIFYLLLGPIVALLFFILN